MRKEMMKKLALVLTLLMLSSTAQARDYVREKVLYCVWPDGRIESFTEGSSYVSPIGPWATWTVASIHQYPNTVRVRLEAPYKEKIINFTNGWPCRMEVDYTFTNHEAVQPESDNFNQID